MTTGKKRVFSLGGKAVLKLVVLVGVLLLANVLAVNLQFGWDASEGRTHSLADSTVALLGKLKGPVHLLVFANRWDRRAEKMLQRFHKANPMVSFEFVDPEAEPAKAKSHEVSGPGVTIVQMGPAKRRLRTLKEQTLAGAILQLAKGRGRKIVFSEGHDEREMAGADKECLGKASALLRAAGYETVQTSLTDDALKGAAVVVVARPRKEISAKEAARVREFVAGGGGLFVLLDPSPTGASLDPVLSPYGMKAPRDFVVELNTMFRHKSFGPDTIYIRARQVLHPVSERIAEAFLLKRVRSIQIAAERMKSKEVLPLYRSSTNSWGETNFDDRSVAWNRGADHRGPRVLVAATKEPPSVAGKGRVMVAGTSLFTTNRFFGLGGSRGFWEAAVSWLAGDLDYPLIAQKEPSKKLDLTDTQLRTVLIVCVLVLPGISAGLGLVVFIRRTE